MRRRAATVASAIAIAMCLASTAGADTDSLPGEPEGEHIVVTVGAGSPGNVPMLMLTPGAPVRFITEALTQDRPAWSPDCRSLVFSRSAPGMELFVAEVGGPARQLTFGHHYGAGSPAWSPDGGTIVFTSYGQAPILALPDPHTELFSIRPDGTGETRLSSQLSAAAQPAWAPDGSELAVIGETAVDTYFQILVLDPKTGAETRRLTNDLAGHHLHPAWSRDGRTVAYALVPQSDPAHDFQPWELAVVGADGSNPHVIVSDPDGRDLYAPSWTPDGRIVFGSAKRGTDSYLEVMNADGTDRHQLARYGSGVIPAVAPRLFTDAAPGTGAPSELIGPEGPPASPAAAPARPVDASGTPTASPPAGSAPAGAPGSDGGVAAKAAAGAAQPRAAVASSKGAGSGPMVAVVIAFALVALSMMFVDYWRRSRRSDTSPDATRRTGGG